VNKPPVIVLGAGGHAKVVIDALRCAGYKVLGLTDANPTRHGASVLGVPVLGGDEAVQRYGVADVQLANGIGSTGNSDLRRAVFEKFVGLGYHFAALLHPSAVVANDVLLGEGAQIMAGVVLQPGCRIGRNVIVNTRAAIDHDCDIGDHAHVSPGATLCGNVTIGASAHIGAGSTVIQTVTVGANALVAAGAVVVRDVLPAAVVVGIPARLTNR